MVSVQSHLILCIKAAVSINRGRKMLLKRFVWEIRKQLLCLNVETKLIKRKIRGNGCVLHQEQNIIYSMVPEVLSEVSRDFNSSF